MKKTSKEETVNVSIEVPGGLGSATSKSEEIELLWKIQRVFAGTQTYLEHLFSEEMVRWCVGKIQDDFSADLFGHYQTEIADNAKLDKVNAEQSIIIDSLRKDSEEKHTLWAKMLEQHRQEIIGRVTELNQIKNLASDRYGEIQELHRDVDAKDEAIKNLKVRLYDLMVAKGGCNAGS